MKQSLTVVFILFKKPAAKSSGDCTALAYVGTAY
jgi:hypothetical protein